MRFLESSTKAHHQEMNKKYVEVPQNLARVQPSFLTLYGNRMHEFIIISGEEAKKKRLIQAPENIENITYEEKLRRLTMFGRRSITQEERRRLTMSSSFPGRQV